MHVIWHLANPTLNDLSSMGRGEFFSAVPQKISNFPALATGRDLLALGDPCPLLKLTSFCLFSVYLKHWSCRVLLTTLVPRCSGQKCLESLLGLELVHRILLDLDPVGRKLRNDHIGRTHLPSSDLPMSPSAELQLMLEGRDLCWHSCHRSP